MLALVAFMLAAAIGAPQGSDAKKDKPPKQKNQPAQTAPPSVQPEQPAVGEEPPAAPQGAKPRKPKKPDWPGAKDPEEEKPRGPKEPDWPHNEHPDPEPGRNAPTPAAPVQPPAAAPSEQPAAQQPPASAPVVPTPDRPAAGQERPARRVDARGGVDNQSSGRRRGAGIVAPSAPVGGGAGAASGSADSGSFDTEPVAPDEEQPAADNGEEEDSGGSPVTRTVEEIVEVVPDSVMKALAGLLALSLVLAGASLLSTVHARRLARQRRELLQEVGLLQSALLPPVPEQLGALLTSVAYRPAEGPGAGGDFYDALTLSDDRVAFILGDVSGHGRAALGRTAFLRYTLRAYLEAGLEPRVALQVAGRVIDQQLEGDFATVVLAVHDPSTASLTFACAGHPAPIVVGPSSYEPVLPGASPPLGIGMRTGVRQTTIPLTTGSVACFFTDGLTEARTERGILGRPRLGDILDELGPSADASEVLERVAAEARLVTDDMAACLISPVEHVTAGGFRLEQLELSDDELGSNVARRFLEACGVDGEEAARAEIEAAEMARRYGGAVLNVSFGPSRRQVEVVPRNVASIETSPRRSIAAS